MALSLPLLKEVEGKMELIKREEVAKRLGISLQTLNTWIRKRGLPCIRISQGRRMFDWEDIVKWLERLKSEGYLS